MATTASRRRVLSIVFGSLSILLLVVLAVLNAFTLRSIRPESPDQILIYSGLSVIAFLLFITVLVLLVRNVLKLYAEQKSGVLGTRLRTRMLWGALLVSLVPIGFMFTFSYGLMNRSVDRWFSQPVADMRDDLQRHGDQARAVRRCKRAVGGRLHRGNAPRRVAGTSPDRRYQRSHGAA